MATASTVKKRLIPGGRAYFQANAAGEMNNLRYLGLSSALTVNVASTTVDSFGAENGTRELDDRTIVQTLRGGALTLRQMTFDNFALFFIGSYTELTQGSATVTDESQTAVAQDRHIVLGTRTSGNPFGPRSISAVDVTEDGGGAQVMVEGTDFTVNTDLGAIYVIPGGAITAGMALVIDYTVPALSSIDHLQTVDLSQNEGTLVNVGNNIKGDDSIAYAPNALLSPNGDFSFKQSDPAYVEVNFDLSFSRGPNDEPALTVDGIPVV